MLSPVRVSPVIFAAFLLIMLQASHANAQAAYSVEIIVQGFPSNLTTNLYVDGGLNGTMTGGSTRTLIFPTSSITHIITVDFYVPNSAGLNGTRYLEPETSWVFSAGGSHTFAYKAQYFLDVQSSFGTTKGEGWYDSGASAQAILNVGEVEESPGTRHAFISWAGDAAGTSLTSSSILMDQPKKAIANWKTQYLLTVKSDPPDVQNLKGSGWYDAATQATFSAPSLVSADQDSRLRFDQWSGAFDGRTPSGTVLMDLPKVVEAHYIAQYQLTINYDPPNIPHTWNQSAWYDANSNVPLGPAVNNIELSSVERLSFMGWFEKGQQLSGVSINVLMDQPHELTLSYQTEYYVDVRSSYGQASGSGWYSRGSTATITVSSTAGSWPITYTLTGWRVDPPSGKLNRSGGSWTILVDQPYVIEAVWNFEVLPLIGLIGGIALLVALVIVALVISYRRGVFARGLSSFKPSKVPAPAAAVCGKCGSQVPKGATFCQKCGSPIAIAAPESSGLEDKVYDYILKHDGVISMKQASRDLGVSADQLKEATEALKRKGRLA